MTTKYFEIVSQSLDTLSQGNILALTVLFLVLALGEWGIPFPFVLQSVLFFIGYQISHGSIQVILLVLILISGRIAGSAVLFWSARALGNPVANWFQRRFWRMQDKLNKLRGEAGIRSPLAVTMGRLTPGLLVPTSLTSGAIGLRYEYFIIGVALSAIIWDGTFILSGIVLGHGAQNLGSNLSVWILPAGFITTICMVWAIQKLIVQRKNREQRITNDE